MIGSSSPTLYTLSSSFHQDTDITPFTASDGNWRALISGVDRRTRAVWHDGASSDLPGLGNTSLRFQVDAASRLGDYVTATVRRAKGPDNAGTFVLYQAVRGDDPVNSDLTRNKFIIKPDTGKAFTEAQASWQLRLPWNLAQLLPIHGHWWELWAVVNPEGDRIISAQIVNVSGALRWRLLGKPSDDASADWVVDDTTTPIPVGTWMKMEMRWAASQATLRVNDATLCEYTQPYALRSDNIEIMSLYSSAVETFNGQVSNFESGWTGLTTAFKYEGSKSAWVTGGTVPTLTPPTPSNLQRYDSMSLRALWNQVGGGNDPALRIRFYTGSARSDLDIPTPSLFAYGNWFLREFDPKDAVPAVGGGADLTAVSKVELFYTVSGFPLRSNLYVDDLRGSWAATGSIEQEVTDVEIRIGRGAIQG